VILIRCLQAGAMESYPLYSYFPLALAGFSTAVLFSVQWLVQLFSGHDQGSRKHHTFSPGAER
jgi:lipid-A-disaccharide synthase-like uncharacterized protein